MKNITTCRDCGGQLETVDEIETDGGALQSMEQKCQDCGLTTSLTIVNYPGGEYVVYAPAVRGDECSEIGCETGAMIRKAPNYGTLTMKCADHMGPMAETALEFRGEL